MSPGKFQESVERFAFNVITSTYSEIHNNIRISNTRTPISTNGSMRLRRLLSSKFRGNDYSWLFPTTRIACLACEGTERITLLPFCRDVIVGPRENREEGRHNEGDV